MHNKYYIKINDRQFGTERAPVMTQTVVSSIPELLFSTSQKKKNSMVKEVEPSGQLQLHNKKKKKTRRKVDTWHRPK